MYKPFLLISLASLPLLAQGKIQICIFLKYLPCENCLTCLSCKPLILKRKLHFIQTNNIFSGGCPDSLPQSGKKVHRVIFTIIHFPDGCFFLQVFCYYEGKKSPHSIDPCPCSHLLYKNVPIDTDSRVRLSNQLSSDLEILRWAIFAFLVHFCNCVKINPDLRSLISKCCCPLEVKVLIATPSEPLYPGELGA